MYIDVLCIQNVYKCRDAKLIEETGTKARRFIVGALLQNIQRSAKRYGVWSIPGIPVTIGQTITTETSKTNSVLSFLYSFKSRVRASSAFRPRLTSLLSRVRLKSRYYC